MQEYLFLCKIDTIFAIKTIGMSQLTTKDKEREYKKFMVQWLPKVVERCSVVLSNISNRAKVSDTDLDVVQAQFRLYYMGYCPDFIPAWTPPNRIKEPKEVTLPFKNDETNDTLTEHTNGIEIESTPCETKKTKKLT